MESQGAAVSVTEVLGGGGTENMNLHETVQRLQPRRPCLEKVKVRLAHIRPTSLFGLVNNVQKQFEPFLTSISFSDAFLSAAFSSLVSPH